jgi:hypothetical protein
VKQNKFKVQNLKFKVKNGFLGIGLIAAIAIIAMVAIIFFGILDLGKFGNLPEVPSIVPDRQIQELENLSDSDDVGVIEQELNDTNVDQLDRESGDLDKAIDQL